MRKLAYFVTLIMVFVWLESSRGNVAPIHLEWTYDDRAHALDLGRK